MFNESKNLCVHYIQDHRDEQQQPTAHFQTLSGHREPPRAAQETTAHHHTRADGQLQHAGLRKPRRALRRALAGGAGLGLVYTCFFLLLFKITGNLQNT